MVMIMFVLRPPWLPKLPTLPTHINTLISKATYFGNTNNILDMFPSDNPPGDHDALDTFLSENPPGDHEVQDGFHPGSKSEESESDDFWDTDVDLGCDCDDENRVTDCNANGVIDCNNVDGANDCNGTDGVADRNNVNRTADRDDANGAVDAEELGADNSPLPNHTEQAEVEGSQGPGLQVEIEKFGGKAGQPIRVGWPAATDGHQTQPSDNPSSPNPYAPFHSQIDWEVAKWGKLRGPTSTAFTELLEIPNVSSWLLGDMDHKHNLTDLTGMQVTWFIIRKL